MNVKKLVAGIATAAIAASCFVIPSAAADSCKAYIFFADKDWIGQYWSSGNKDNTLSDSLVKTATVTGDGTYTVSVDVSAGYTNSGATYTDLKSIASLGMNIDGAASAWSNIKVEVNSISFGGTKATLDASKITQGTDSKDSSIVRLDIYNQYVTPKIEAVNPENIATYSTIEINFTVSGTGKQAGAAETTKPVETTTASETTAAADDNKDKPGTPDTGVNGLAAVAAVLAVASAAAVISRKNKDAE